MLSLSLNLNRRNSWVAPPSPSATAPSKPDPASFTVTNANANPAGGGLNLNVVLQTPDGGAAIDQAEYRVDGGAGQAMGLLGIGVFSVLGLPNDVAASLAFRLHNSVDWGPWSDPKSDTPTDNNKPSGTFFINATTGQIDIIGATEPGTCFLMVNSDPSVLAGAVIEAGAGALVVASFAFGVGDTSGSIDITGLAEAGYTLHGALKDPSANYSDDPALPFTVVDSIAPVLSAATAVKTGTTTADFGFDTDTQDGSFDTVFSKRNVAPNQAQVAAGQDDLGAACDFAANGQTVAAQATQSGSATGLTPATQYYPFSIQRDAAGVPNVSTVIPHPSITTDAVASGISIISNPVEIAAQTTNNTPDITESPFTTVAGTDTALLLLVPGYQSSAATQEGLVTPQWDGVDMVRIQVSAETGKEWAEGWILLNPTVKTETMALTALNNQNAIGGVLMQLAGVDQTTPTAGAAQSKGTGTTTTFGVTTTADGSWIIGLVTVESNEQPFTANNGATVPISGNTGTSEFSDLSYAVVTKLVPTAGADTPGVDWASDEKFIQIQFELLKA